VGGALDAMNEEPKGQLFAENGFLVVPDVVGGDQCEVLAQNIRTLGNGGAGFRALLDQTWCVELARELRRQSKLCALLPVDAVAVQCTLFDKSPDKNWLVSLHQDLSIPVRRHLESVECSGWSEKEGRVYVQPPVAVLEQLVAVRIHIEDCPAESGALRVVPKSHLEGRLTRDRVEELRRQIGECRISRNGPS
jgi:hypothetical protein